MHNVFINRLVSLCVSCTDCTGIHLSGMDIHTYKTLEAVNHLTTMCMY